MVIAELKYPKCCFALHCPAIAKPKTVIPASFDINLPFNIPTPDIPTHSEATVELNDTRKDLIEEIRLTALTMNLKSPANGNFNFLKSVTICIGAEGLEETKIAWRENILNTKARTLDLITSGADLQEYIKKDTYTPRLNTVTDEVITSDYKLNINSVFYIDAKILGQ